MLRTLVAFLPDSMMVLVIAAVGLCLIVGAISLKKALQWLGFVVMLLVSAPFCDAIVDMLPGWLLFALLGIAAWMALRFIAGAVLGREAASHMIGILAADAVRGGFRLGFRLAVLPFRFLRFAWRSVRSRLATA